MSEYGLPDVRDKDGDLQAVEHEYEWNGQPVTIKLMPPTIPEYAEYENFGAETENEDLRQVIDRHLVKPDIPEDAHLTMPELLCYVEGIVDYCNGSAGLGGAAREELEDRVDGGAEGN